ncbi:MULTISPECIES: DUF3888 domain-containing protein [Oceanobacillus]|uniref:DUF3888 domain-containing protein n=1 Tax=Oceanobacillus kimchii TaxID=746691 RepID=A0ABQ5TD16_9BACI|nr:MULTISPECIES: DUF3888 domain-containing protein [Oceanobacillus]MBT2653147.1 DUF3888 domain-containing protein [Oceanobacillus sp. ISL-73]MCT1577751.1 DUF3888 domain-containing protein [Oceanobacillus kimchii]MCT2136739.1 DUF3888 domain-containing protein [Oceanobacillus kimchii]OEH53872.1 hypothetical protein AQ616_15455 [Oceanobacillus sp. E9]GLO64524.1 hypothetical protein MACH08_03080 [Oceanobacillus kimchii]
MKRILVLTCILSLCISVPSAFAKPINEADTDFTKTLEYALIISLIEPIDEAITTIYKDDKNAPEDLEWSVDEAEILKIKQLGEVGEAYEITLKVFPYYGNKQIYGEDLLVVQAGGELIEFHHLDTYHVKDERK